MTRSSAVQHIEFFNRDHFYHHFHRQKAKSCLSTFIDFFWETNFDALWQQFPDGFTDALFPDLGYTYMINLGTPFKMRFDRQEFVIKKDGFVPRYKNLLTLHAPGNRIFGIKFRVSPIIFQKKINFSEYTQHIFPLTYLVDKTVADKVRLAGSFEKRIVVISAYYEDIIKEYPRSLHYVNTVKDILKDCSAGDFTTTVGQHAARHKVSTRTLQRYFESATSISSKQAIQIMRIRKAITAFIESPASFNCADFGYFDYSHFYKHVSGFLKGHNLPNVRSPLQLLEGTGIINY